MFGMFESSKFTIGAFILTAFIVWMSSRANDRDRRAVYDPLNDAAATRLLLLHIRQDLALIAFVLFGILIMLGVIADFAR